MPGEVILSPEIIAAKLAGGSLDRQAHLDGEFKVVGHDVAVKFALLGVAFGADGAGLGLGDLA